MSAFLDATLIASSSTIEESPSTSCTTPTSSPPNATVAVMPGTTPQKESPKNNNNDKSRPTKKEEQDASVLHDVLDELDRERTKRAELEAQVRELKQDLHSQKQKNKQILSSPKNGGNANFISPKDFTRLETERDSYLEIIHALTQHRPSFNTRHQTLPLHVVRLLEVIPWDPRSRAHLFGQEEVYEWQMLGADHKTWHKQLRYFPSFFKTLPIVTPQRNRTVGESHTGSSPPKQCVLTNIDACRILNIDNGYPLPKDGGDWIWVGGWRIERSTDTDDQGWSYSNSPEMTSDLSYFSELRMPEPGCPNLVRRRRKWTRTRVLVDYPYASSMTKQYLKLVAENASLNVTVDKLSSQLVETKMSLTTLEDEHMSHKDEMARQIARLEKEIEEKNRVISFVEEAGLNTTTPLPVQHHKDQVKELRSVVTQWVSNTVAQRQQQQQEQQQAGLSNSSRSSNGSSGGSDGDDRTTSTQGSDEDRNASEFWNNSNKDDIKQQVFESLRGRGGHLLEKIRQKGGEEFERIKQKGGEELEKIKQKGGEELEKIKQQKEGGGGLRLAAWTAKFGKTDKVAAAPATEPDTLTTSVSSETDT